MVITTSSYSSLQVGNYKAEFRDYQLRGLKSASAHMVAKRGHTFSIWYKGLSVMLYNNPVVN